MLKDDAMRHVRDEWRKRPINQRTESDITLFYKNFKILIRLIWSLEVRLIVFR
jgi:hypothetical protein